MAENKTAVEWLVKQKKSNLSKRLRDYVKYLMELE
jgi:hypothetical protein